MTTQRYMAFSGGGLDHCENEREAEQIQAALHEVAARTVFFHQYRPAVAPDGRIIKAHPSELANRELYDPAIVFLGRSESDNRPWFAAHLKSPDGLVPEDQFVDLRMTAGGMEAQELAIIGRAKALIDWHGSHGYCAKCGVRSAPAKGAIMRICNTCSTEHYPRVNPVAIMLVEHEGDMLLGRQSFWPEGSYSTLAGFVSPGEDLEEACAREVFEEVGLRVTGVRYLMSQSWPFPSQLMMGLVCTASSRDIVIDEKELEDARWFSRDEVEAVFAKVGDSFRRPPRFTIAHQLIRAWLDGV